MPLGMRVETSTGLGFTIWPSPVPVDGPVVVNLVTAWMFISVEMADVGVVGVVDPGDSRRLSGCISGLAGTSPVEHWIIGSRVVFSLSVRMRALRLRLVPCLAGSVAGS